MLTSHLVRRRPRGGRPWWGFRSRSYPARCARAAGPQGSMPPRPATPGCASCGASAQRGAFCCARRALRSGTIGARLQSCRPVRLRRAAAPLRAPRVVPRGAQKTSTVWRRCTSACSSCWPACRCCTWCVFCARCCAAAGRVNSRAPCASHFAGRLHRREGGGRGGHRAQRQRAAARERALLQGGGGQRRRVCQEAGGARAAVRERRVRHRAPRARLHRGRHQVPEARRGRLPAAEGAGLPGAPAFGQGCR